MPEPPAPSSTAAAPTQTGHGAGSAAPAAAAAPACAGAGQPGGVGAAPSAGAGRAAGVGAVPSVGAARVAGAGALRAAARHRAAGAATGRAGTRGRPPGTARRAGERQAAARPAEEAGRVLVGEAIRGAAHAEVKAAVPRRQGAEHGPCADAAAPAHVHRRQRQVRDAPDAASDRHHGSAAGDGAGEQHPAAAGRAHGRARRRREVGAPVHAATERRRRRVRECARHVAGDRPLPPRRHRGRGERDHGEDGRGRGDPSGRERGDAHVGTVWGERANRPRSHTNGTFVSQTIHELGEIRARADREIALAAKYAAQRRCHRNRGRSGRAGGGPPQRDAPGARRVGRRSARSRGCAPRTRAAPRRPGRGARPPTAPRPPCTTRWRAPR